MPTVTIYFAKNEKPVVSKDFIPQLKDLLVKELSCGEIALTPEEISVRLVHADGGGMIADIELEIAAHAFGERIKKQDVIFNTVRQFVLKELPHIRDARVWLQLSELGHSW